ncbi:lysine--tRNA ligase [Malacoplasma muris]|uniref:lysine--tRNA ligase n=1 Tax=Malacoplasma muris TaxID=2119 RepID=UPI00398E83EA
MNKNNRVFNDQEKIRREKLSQLQSLNMDPYSVEYVRRTLNLGEFRQKYASLKNETHSKDNHVLVGRVMNLRQTFGVIKDFFGQLQFYLNKKELDEKVFNYFNKYVDIGDIVEIKGNPFVTMKGELSLNVKEIRIVSKSLKPLPEKYHGLQDEELRARHRYVDLITNSESMETFVLRSLIVKYIRNFMDGNGYFEVETPVLHPILGGANARPFKTFHNALKRDYYLRVATELPLKKLIVGGFDRVYEIGRIFRNEGMDATHNPEFTSMEAYTAYQSMEDTMDLVENIFHYVAQQLKVKEIQIPAKDENGPLGPKIEIAKKFKRIRMTDFVKEVTGVDFDKVKDDKEALEIAKKHNVQFEKHQKTKGHILNLFFEQFCEEKCIQPTFVWGHPTEVSPLSKKDYQRPGYTKRFELFINTKEYANAFAELNDPIDQYERFEDQINEKELGNDEAVEMDMDFIEALEYGLPPTGGLGIGIDRLVMLFSNKLTIRDVLLFPHMKDKI